MRVVAALMGVFVLVVVGAVAIGLVDTEEKHPDGWQYDDYVQIEGVVSASGALELMDVGGTTYVHAGALGTGSYTTSDGTVTVDVSRAVLDVWLMTGQSNSAYNQADPASAEPVPPPGTAYAYMSSDGAYSGLELSGADPAFRSMTNPDGTSATADKAPSFAATYYKETGHKVYWICGGVGGRPILTFDPSVGATWQYMHRTVEKALAAVDTELYTLEICGYMWIQGEADSTLDIDTYKDRFLRMHKAILSGALGVDFDHCFMVPPVPSRGLNSVVAQHELAEENPSTITLLEVSADFTVANGMISSDGVHWSQAGDNVVGVALGNACAVWEAGRPSGAHPLMGIWPVLIGLAVGVLAIGVVLRLIAGRD